MIAVCLHCKVHYKPLKNAKGIYCSVKCQAQLKQKTVIDAWLSGIHPGYTGKTLQLCNAARTWLHQTRGTACSQCGWDQRHPDDGSVLTEIDHIDGDAKNCRPDNLRILCPNCHSMTSTFRARNKSSSRIR